MTKYRVTMKEIVLHEHFIEADTSIEAFEIAWGIDDLSSSTEVQGAGWIELGEVIEMATEEDSISWGELAELTHATQVERFNWCSCEEQEQFPYADCPRNEVA